MAVTNSFLPRDREAANNPPRHNSMNIYQMDEDLKRFTDFEQLSNRVVYWERRLKFTTDADRNAFYDVVAKHSRRALGVLRAG